MDNEGDGFGKVRDEVERLAALINAPEGVLPTYGRSRDLGYPHIERLGDLWSWVVVERGVEIDRQSTLELDELLYWIFEAVTFSMACDWELRHRVEGQDFRILLWTKQFELLQQLEPRWVERLKVEKRLLLQQVGLAELDGR